MVAEAKQKLPQLKAYYLSSFKNTGTRWSPTVDELIKQAKAINADGLDVAYRGPLDEAFVRKVRNARLELYAWTVNDPDVARDLVKLGVDGITSDKAAWLREELSKPAEE